MFKKLSFIKALNSPLKPFKLRFYLGKVAVGVPYFYPRRWIKNKEKPGYLKAVDRKIGFDFCELGWKTKWEATDFRFEYAPVFSFVFFKWQFAVKVIAPHQDMYWAIWLYYDRFTDKKKSKRERLLQCREEFPQIWISHNKDGTKERIDYYDKVLKKKYGK